jgi:hypothetical protein
MERIKWKNPIGKWVKTFVTKMVGTKDKKGNTPLSVQRQMRQLV